MGSARSARRIQPGGSGRPGRGDSRSPRGTAARSGPAAAGRTSSAVVRRDRLRVGLEGSGAKVARRPGVELYSASRSDFAASPGAVGSVSAPSLRWSAEGRGPSLPTRTSTGADCPQSVSDRAAPQGGDRPPKKGCPGSAARSATHPTRLETRTKESNARASRRVSSSPRGAMKVKVGARRPRWDPPAPAGGAPPARLAPSEGEVEQERVR